MQSFLTQNPTFSQTLLKSVEQFYNLSKKEDDSNSGVLDHLIIQDFDDNQIWEQLNLDFSARLDMISAQLPMLSADQASISDDLSSQQEHQDKEAFESDISESELDAESIQEDLINEDDINEDDVFDEDEAIEMNSNDESENQDALDETDESELDEEDSGSHELNPKQDLFEQMEQFADFMEEKEELQRKRQEMSGGKDIKEKNWINTDDLLNDPEAFDEEDDLDNANEIRYTDFFEAKPSKKRRIEQAESESSDQEDGNDLLEGEENREEMKDSQNLFDDDDAENENDANSKSTFEKQQEKVRKMIEILEAEAVAEKDWTLKGEITAKKRPANSLLEQDLEIDYAMKPVPIIDPDTTQSLEDKIKQRIKDQAWDDVVRKVAVQEKNYDPNRERENQDEKSKKSLAEIYEEEYVRQTRDDSAEFKTEKDDALEKKHSELESLFKGLCEALDALSNSHFVPKAPTLDIEVLPRPDVPALAMEDITPATVSDAKLVAPEEVYKTKVGKSAEELNAQDRKRLRAKQKKIKKRENMEREKAKKDAQAVKATSKKRIIDSVADKEEAMKQLMNQENVTIIADNSNKQQLAAKKKTKANVIEKGGKVRAERKKQRAEFIKL